MLDATPPLPADPSDSTQPLRATLRAIASVIAPSSLITALVYYFGWARTSSQATALGLDDSLLGYSNKDYLLRSVDAMFWPMFVGTLVTTGALLGHGALVGWATGSNSSGERPSIHRRRRLAVWLAPSLAGIGAASLILGTIGARLKDPGRLASMATPICVSVGIVLVGYAAHLRRLLSEESPHQPSPELRAVRLITSSLLCALFLLSLFWTVSRYAVIKGIDLAVTVEDGLSERPDATIYSSTRLHLQPPVLEKRLQGEGPDVQFSYSGLKFLFRSEGKLFLRPSDPSARDVNIIISNRDDLRLELVRAW